MSTISSFKVIENKRVQRYRLHEKVLQIVNRTRGGDT